MSISRRFWKLLISITALILFVFSFVMPAKGQQSTHTGQYARQWAEVDSLTKQGLPRSALVVVERIYADASRRGRHPEMIRAVIHRISLRADYEDGVMVGAIEQLREELEKSSDEVLTAVLSSLIAEVYHGYYRQNIYRFRDRTALSDYEEGDFRLWDLDRLAREILYHYNNSLLPVEMLQQIPLKQYAPILKQEKGSQIFRPTLYDFLAHRALDFFTSDLTGLSRPAEQFSLNHPGYLSDNATFSRMEIITPDTMSLLYHAMKLYRDLTLFHLSDSDPRALLELTLARLDFARRKGGGIPDVESRYISQLEALSQQYLNHAYYPLIRYHLANRLYLASRNHPSGITDNDGVLYTVKAHEICREAIERHPRGVGVSECKDLIQSLEEKALSFRLPEVIAPEEHLLFITNFKNLETIHYKLLQVDYDQYHDMIRQPRNIRIAWLNGHKPLKSWSVTSDAQRDFLMHHFEYGVEVPNSGFYALMASAASSFSILNNLTATGSFQVSRLAYAENHLPQGGTQLVVTDRLTGVPQRNVRVQAFSRSYDYTSRQWKSLHYGEYVTNRDGLVVIPPPTGSERSSVRLRFTFITSGGDTLRSQRESYIAKPTPPSQQESLRSHLFLDRMIYRPGQKIYFKGILERSQGKVLSAAADRSIPVQLLDVNGNSVGSLELQTNEFGSFQGSFVIPAGGLTGNMRLVTPHGTEYFRVEEYKRPTFQVTLLPVEGIFRPGDTVMVQGKGDAYAGYHLTGAAVQWRVVREVRFPWRPWYRRHGWYPSQPDTEIAHGTTTTNDDGLFTIHFPALPDPATPAGQHPVYHYTVYVDITDMNGETHSGTTTVLAGNRTILLTNGVPPQIERTGNMQFPVEASNLNKQPLELTGRYSLYWLEEPSKLFRNRLWQDPDTWVMEKAVFQRMFPHDPFYAVASREPVRHHIAGGTFNTQNRLDLSVLQQSEGGNYVLVLQTTDPNGDTITHETSFLLFGANDSRLAVPAFFNIMPLQRTAQPGETITILAGSSERTQLRYVIEVNGRIQKEEWLDMKGRQQQVIIPIEEQHRGGIAIHFFGVYLNRSFTQTVNIHVPFQNKKLDIRFASFRDMLLPGAEEEYTITIKGSGGERVLAELLAGMYDASLDQFAYNQWHFNPFMENRARLRWQTPLFGVNYSSTFGSFPEIHYRKRTQNFDQLNWYGFMPRHGYVARHRGDMSYPMQVMDSDEIMLKSPMMAIEMEEKIEESIGEKREVVTDTVSSVATEMPSVVPRTNFNETAFFFPQMKTDEEGNVVFRFTVPEALTAWKLMLLAHTPDLKSAVIERTVVTQKPLMVVPNAPRFFREGDKITFTSRVTNLSDSAQVCAVLLTLTDALSGNNIDVLTGNLEPRRQLTLKGGESGMVSWELQLPARVQAVTVRVVAASGSYSDGEERTVPVLTNRMLVTESLPLWLTGKETRTFRHDKLMQSGSSTTLRHHKLTLEYTSNPVWYAIQALPYLMEFPYECSEQIFSRLYANTMATHIANSAPHIKAVFDHWKHLTPDALLSNLEKNQELKALLLEETPWVRDAASEQERKQRVGLLFDLNRMADETSLAVRQLREAQTPNGGWPWFKGGPDSWYITQHIMTGIGRMTAMNVVPSAVQHDFDAMTASALRYLDARLVEHYDRLKRTYRDEPAKINDNHLSQLIIMYLYTRSWYLQSHPVPRNAQEAFGWLQRQGVRYWNGQGILMQGYLALALNRQGEKETAQRIMRSLKERSLYDEELGRYWRATAGYFWYEAPIERQALLIEAFDEVAGDRVAVEEMKRWLLKQKQTQDWKSTKATAEACYALLMRGTDLLQPTAPAHITLGGVTVDPFRDGGTTPEAGTGYFKTSWDGTEVTPAMGEVTVTGTSEGASWGALYWQYFEQLDKITPHATPLKIRKQLFLQENTPAGVVLKPITEGGTVQVGNRVVVRIELRVDRDMEFVHMKDMRASAFEPVTTLSGYRWQDGLGYYESPRDASVNFFFDYLRKGTYLFEYTLFATHAGEFSNGITTIQSMYAPEFTSHSEGVRVLVESR